jgi:hypothetical protein
MSNPAQSFHSELHGLLRNYGAIKPVEGENGAQSGRRQIGLTSAIFIIFNGMVGAG